MILCEDGLYGPRRTEKADCGCEALRLSAGSPGGPLGPGAPSGPAEKQNILPIVQLVANDLCVCDT